MSNNELCVYRAGNMEEANVVVAWLADRGIATIVPDRHTITTLGMPNIIPGHVEVCLTDASQLAEARALVAEHDEQIKEHIAAVGATGETEVACEKCGTKTRVPRAEAGHVVECPKCHEFIDVPDPTDTAG